MVFMSGLQFLSYPYLRSTNLSKLLAGHYSLLLEQFNHESQPQTPSSLDSYHYLSPRITPALLLSQFYSSCLIFISFCSSFPLCTTESLRWDQESNISWSNLIAEATLAHKYFITNTRNTNRLWMLVNVCTVWHKIYTMYKTIHKSTLMHVSTYWNLDFIPLRATLLFNPPYYIIDNTFQGSCKQIWYLSVNQCIVTNYIYLKLHDSVL